MAMAPKKITMLKIIEVVDGPMGGQQALFEAPAKGKFTNKIEAVYKKGRYSGQGSIRKDKAVGPDSLKRFHHRWISASFRS